MFYWNPLSPETQFFFNDRDVESGRVFTVLYAIEEKQRVHACALMSNHHLFLETPEANLVDGMKWFQGTYTQRFNAMFQCRGHLLQGRYNDVRFSNVRISLRKTFQCLEKEKFGAMKKPWVFETLLRYYAADACRNQSPYSREACVESSPRNNPVVP